MKKLFPEFYPPSDGLDVHWKTCTFVLDANILLAAYRLPKEGREDLLKMLEALKDRLWVPYQAALEYQRNKLTVISEQKNGVSDVLKHIDKIFSDFEKGLLNHRLIRPEALIREVQEVLDRHKKDFLSIQAEQPDVHQPDEIGDRIDAIIGGAIGAAMDQSEIDAINKEGEFRYINEVPPGFKDAKKTGAYFHQGIKYQAKFGDLYLWKQALKHVKGTDLKFFTFVTGDQKDDWWLRIGGKTIGAPPNLRDEAHQNGASHFHMYSLPQFLEYGKGHLEGGVSSVAIEQANELNVEASHDSRRGRLGLYVKTIPSLITTNSPSDLVRFLSRETGISLRTYDVSDGFIVSFSKNVPRRIMMDTFHYIADMPSVESVEIIDISGMIPDTLLSESEAKRIVIVFDDQATDDTFDKIDVLAQNHFASFTVENDDNVMTLSLPRTCSIVQANRFTRRALRLRGVAEVAVE